MKKMICAGLVVVAFIPSTILAQQHGDAWKQLQQLNGDPLEQVLSQFRSEKSGAVITRSVAESVVREMERNVRSDPRKSTTNYVGVLLRRFPVLHIIVTPVPPRDYTIKINGETQPVTDQSRYVVQNGMTIVTVQRVGIPPCTWREQVDTDKEISCALRRE